MVSFLHFSKLISAAFGIAVLAARLGAARPHSQTSELARRSMTIDIPTPQFEVVYDGIIEMPVGALTYLHQSPFGTEMLIEFLGGNVTDSKTGQQVAIVLPMGGIWSIQSNSTGVFYTDVRMTIQWMDDMIFHHAALEQQGIGSIVNGTILKSTDYARMTTGSVSRQHLVENVLLLSTAIYSDDAANQSYAQFRLFQQTNWLENNYNVPGTNGTITPVWPPSDAKR